MRIQEKKIRSEKKEKEQNPSICFEVCLFKIAADQKMNKSNRK